MSGDEMSRPYQTLRRHGLDYLPVVGGPHCGEMYPIDWLDDEAMHETPVCVHVGHHVYHLDAAADAGDDYGFYWRQPIVSRWPVEFPDARTSPALMMGSMAY